MLPLDNNNMVKGNKTMIFEIVETASSIDNTISPTSQENDERKQSGQGDEPMSVQWSNAVNDIRHFVNRQIQRIANKAATNPKSCIAITFVVCILMVVIGLFTNFNTDAMDTEAWLPYGSRSAIHNDWISDESGFSTGQRNTLINVHGHGENIAGMEGIRRAFEVVDAIKNLTRYHEFCKPGVVEQEEFVDGCPLWGVTQFWDHNVKAFENEIHSDEEATTALSAEKFPSGQYVHPPSIMGNVGMLYGTVVFVQSFPIFIVFPEKSGVEIFELDVIDAVLKIQKQWEEESTFDVEIHAPRSVPDELHRSVVNDIPLFPLCYVLMSLFVCVVFYKSDAVKSRTVLGVGAIVSVLLSIMFAYGLMFTIGIPLSQMTQLLPFILFGIGLDDVFIVLGAYSRTNPKHDPVQRIDETMADIGSSIFLTTMTSSLAFAFGAVSTIPVVRSLCHYAYTTIFVIFILQVTFFVALIVLDEQRIQANRRDCCACCIVPKDSTEDEEENAVTDSQSSQTAGTAQVHFADQVMGWYAKKLLHPIAQFTVLVIFGTVFASMCYSVSQLKQYFDFTEMLPIDSYITNYYLAATDYSQQTSAFPAIYFRCVDQADPEIQRQMENFVKEVVELKEVDEPPPLFWLRDFKLVVEQGKLHDLTFEEQLDIFLDIPIFKEMYSRDIVRDDRGNIIASRTVVDMSNVDLLVVDEMIEALKNQREVAMKQRINTQQGMKDRTPYEDLCEDPDNWAFFMFDIQFPTWEFYTTASQELIFSTVIGIAAVTVVGMLLIPHWSVVLFIFPLITMTYIDLLGLLQFLGATINAMTYVSMVMSIGLMVDFLMHILLRYFECEGNKNRRERVVETMETMGASVLLGGFSSFLGVLPLAISKTLVVRSIFLNFISLVVVGITHGLILLPVLLSLLGPTDIVSNSRDKQLLTDGTDQLTNVSDGMLQSSRSRTGTMDSLTTDGTLTGSFQEGNTPRRGSKETLYSQNTDETANSSFRGTVRRNSQESLISNTDTESRDIVAHRAIDCEP